MYRLYCFLFGHRRLGIARINFGRHILLSHLSGLAGLDSVCFFCGSQTSDAGPLRVTPAPPNPYRASARSS